MRKSDRVDPGDPTAETPAERTKTSRSLFNGGVLSAFGERDYTYLWTGALISNIGTWVQTAALLWLIKNILHSNSWVGAVNMANFLPVLFIVPFAGSLADRYSRRRLIIIGQTVMMLGAFALGVTASFHVDSKPVIIITVAVIGVAFAFNFPAWQAILPDMVPHDDMLNAIALSSAQWNLARFIGPVIGAVILTYFSPATAFYANAVSFLFVLAALLIIHPKRGAIEKPSESMMHQVREGFVYVWHRKWMVNILIALGAVALFGFSYIVLIPSLIQDVLGGGAGRYGFLLGMTGLGAVIGAPLVTYLIRYYKERNVVKAAMLGLGLFLLAFAGSRTYWLSCLISIGLGACFLMTSAATNSVLQGCSEREMRGRVISIYIMVFVGVAAIGGQLMGYISDVRSTPFSLLIGGLVCVAVSLVLIVFPKLIQGAATEECQPPYEPWD
jgi:MFS family permease